MTSNLEFDAQVDYFTEWGYRDTTYMLRINGMKNYWLKELYKNATPEMRDKISNRFTEFASELMVIKLSKIDDS